MFVDETVTSKTWIYLVLNRSLRTVFNRPLVINLLCILFHSSYFLVNQDQCTSIPGNGIKTEDNNDNHQEVALNHRMWDLMDTRSFIEFYFCSSKIRMGHK